ncbi:MAG TPA: AI-2E family transporter [Gemmatimonadales bacterium]|nr:AI-2E family transporter [Gemmatimonadales bacterium]
MVLFVAALLLWFALRVFTVIMLLFLAVLAAIYLSAITDILEHRVGAPRWVGLLCAVFGTLVVVAGVGALILPPVIDQTEALVSALPQTFTDAQAVLARWASRYPVVRRTALADPASGLVGGLLNEGVAFLRGSLLPYVRAGGAVLVDAASVFVMALYLARQPGAYRSGVLALVAPRHRALGARVLDDLGTTLRAWVVGQLLDMVVLALVTTLGLWALSVPYWLAFGLLAGVAAIVPFFGTLVSTMLPALFVLSSGDWVKAGAVVALGVAIHLIEANVLAPFIMEREVALPPVLTIAAVLVMATLLGAVGLVVAVPVLAVAMVVVRDVLQGQIYGDPIDEVEAGLPHRRRA